MYFSILRNNDFYSKISKKTELDAIPLNGLKTGEFSAAKQ